MVTVFYKKSNQFRNLPADDQHFIITFIWNLNCKISNCTIKTTAGILNNKCRTLTKTTQLDPTDHFTMLSRMSTAFFINKKLNRWLLNKVSNHFVLANT